MVEVGSRLGIHQKWLSEIGNKGLSILFLGFCRHSHANMKAISGSVTSSEQISVKEAARVLSRFVSQKNGSTQGISSYLKLASASFNELIQFHKELKPQKSGRKRRKSVLETAADGNLTEAGNNPREDEEGVIQSVVLNLDERKSRNGEYEDETSSRVKRKKKKKMEGGEEEFDRSEGRSKKKKKKREEGH